MNEDTTEIPVDEAPKYARREVFNLRADEYAELSTEKEV